MREGAWVGRAPAGSGSGRHVAEGGLSAARAARCAALLRRRQPLFRAGAWRRAAASVAGAGAAQRASAGSESDRHDEEGGCRRLAWLEARLRCAAASLTADPAPGGRGEPRTIVAGGGGAAVAARASLQPRLRSRRRPLHLPHAPPSRLSALVGRSRSGRHRVRARRLCAARCGAGRAWRSVWCVERRVVGQSVLCAGCSHSLQLRCLCYSTCAPGRLLALVCDVLSFLTSSGTTVKFSRRVDLGVNNISRSNLRLDVAHPIPSHAPHAARGASPSRPESRAA